MDKSNSNKATTVILLVVIVVLLGALIFVVVNNNVDKNNVSNNNSNIQNNNNENSENNKDNNEVENLTINSNEVKELISMIGKVDASLTNPKELQGPTSGAEELLYRHNNAEAKSLDAEAIMYIIFDYVKDYKTIDTSSTISYGGANYKVGYVISKEKVVDALKVIFGDNLTTMPSSTQKVNVYCIGINGVLAPKYARYNASTGEIEMSLDDVATGFEGTNMYINSYDRVEQPDDNTLEIYEKVAFTNNSAEITFDKVVKLNKDIELKEMITSYNNNGELTFDEDTIKNYLSSFGEYKYTFTKGSDNLYHFKSVVKVK